MTDPILPPNLTQATDNVRVIDLEPLLDANIDPAQVIAIDTPTQTFKMTFQQLLDWILGESPPPDLTPYALKAGDTFTGQVKGITAVAPEDLTRLDLVQSLIAAIPIPPATPNYIKAWGYFNSAGGFLAGVNIAATAKEGTGQYLVTSTVGGSVAVSTIQEPIQGNGFDTASVHVAPISATQFRIWCRSGHDAVPYDRAMGFAILGA